MATTQGQMKQALIGYPRTDNLIETYGTKAERELVAGALRTYKLKKTDLVCARAYVKTEIVLLVTKGGKKFYHKKGEPAQFKLTHVEITGERPKPAIEPFFCPRANGRCDTYRVLGTGSEIPDHQEWCDRLSQWCDFEAALKAASK